MKNMRLTGIFKEDIHGGYTCWITEMPEVISQGNTLEEARINLIDALKLTLEYKQHDYKRQSTNTCKG